MGSRSARLEEQMKTCGKLLAFLMSHKDGEPFLHPVRWKEWGLNDYPKIIKNPMDLTTVKGKLESGSYTDPKEFKHDVNLVWNNCMTYNADGSEYYLLASTMKRIFEEKYAKAFKEEEESGSKETTRPPTVIDKKMFSQNIYNIAAEDLGRVVHMLDQRCEMCIRKIDADDIEVDIDAIDPATFWAVDAFVRECLPGSRKTVKPKATAPAPTPSAVKTAAGAGKKAGKP